MASVAAVSDGSGDVMQDEGVQTTDWSEARLQRMIADEVEESLNLEYKQCDALRKNDRSKKEVSKDVSSFANSAGGTIIYGVVEEGHRPTALDAGYDPGIITKEWLEDVITGGIQPRVEGVAIHPVPLPKTAAGRFAYVVEIPPSATAHQAKDKKYYKRFNFKAEPMEHYEIQDVLNRRKTASVMPDFRWTRTAYDEDKDIAEFRLGAVLENTGVIRASDVKLVMVLPKKILGRRTKNFSARYTTASTNGHPPYQAVELTAKGASEVIFPGDEWRLTEEMGFKLDYRIDRDIIQNFLPKHRPVLSWTVYADDMPPRSGTIPVADLHDY